MPRQRKPKLAVWKFASCEGCQPSVLDFSDGAYFRQKDGARPTGKCQLILFTFTSLSSILSGISHRNHTIILPV